MDREAAVEFYSRLMRNLQLSVHRFRVSDFPEVDMGLWQSFGFSIRENYLPAEEQIAGQTIYMAEDMFLWRYILMRLPQDESLLLAGPYLNEGVTDQTIMAIMEETGIPPAHFAQVRQYYHSMRVISGDSLLLPIVNTLGDALWGEERFSMELLTLRRDAVFSPDMIRKENELGERQDIALIEKRYEIETKLMYAIAHGQTSQAGAILSMIHPDQIDQRNPNPLRNIKNYAIICNTLMRKAAQQGSVHPYYIDQLSSALGTLSDGLGEMSGKMNENVTDAIDTLNGTQEADEDSTVKLYFHVDQSRNVMVTSTLSSMMNGLAANTGLSIETKYENKIPDELNNFYFAMVFMMLVMFTSMIPGILTGFLTRPSAESRIGAKTKTTAGQIILIGIIAVCLGFIIPRAIAWMGGFDLPVERLTPFIMICCFSMMMLIVGAVDLIGRPGVIVPVLIMICGTAVANLPYEYLPAFWQKYVFPWEPLRFIAEGVREIIYRGGEWFNQYTQNMLWLVAIGAILMILSVLKRGKRDAVSE